MIQRARAAWRSHPDRWAWLLLLLLMALYIGYFGAFSVLKHQSFQTHTSDLGNMDQPIWNTLHGRFVEETRHDGRQATRLTDHFEPIFLLVSLVFLIYDDVVSLLVLQTALLASGAVPVYLLARGRLGSRAAGLVFALAYLLFPALQAANLTEFHASPLAVPFLLFALYFGVQRRPVWLAVFVLLSLATKEEVALLVFMLGLYLLVVERQRVMGAVVALAGLAWFYVATFVIIAGHSQAFYVGVDEGSVYFKRYAHLGSGPMGMLRALVQQPGQVLALLLTPERLAYLGKMLGPFGFLPALGPAALVMTAPILAANLLSDYPAMYSGEYHYSALVVPYVAAAAVWGAAWVKRTLTQRLGWPARPVVGGLCLWLLAWSVAGQVAMGWTPLNPRLEWPQVTPHHRLLARFAVQIPPEASLSTTPPLFPHLDHRVTIYEFPVVLEADYVLVDAASTTDMHPNDFQQAVLRLLRRSYCVRDAADGYLLLARAAPGAACQRELPDAFFDWVRAGEAQPAYPARVEFDGRLRFLGFDLVDQPKWGLTKVRMYWQALEPLEQDYLLYPFFLDRRGDVREDTTQRPLAATLWYPTSCWQPGEVVAVETVPWDLGPWWGLGLGVLAADAAWPDAHERLPATLELAEDPWRLFDGGTWVRLHSFARERGALRLVTPNGKRMPDHSLEARFGEAIALLGYDVRSAEGPEGPAVELTLYWQAVAPVDRPYTVFVHLTDGAGQRVAQDDAQPNWDGPVPADAWRVGEVVKDTHILRPSGALDWPPYQVAVGWYWWETGQRLPVWTPDGGAPSDHLTWAVEWDSGGRR
ncbi:MAG: DUF2079 domain-containing protein [Chloroflexi bacterium]|nr:DUF2079 domain-containing protein [Chloroflexota bacterium]